jgi:hypothetical protein
MATRIPVATAPGGGTVPAAATVSTIDDRQEVRFKSSERSIEHIPPRNDYNIQAGGDPVLAKQLAGQALGPVPVDSGSDLSRCRDTEPGALQAIRYEEHGHELPVDADTGIVGPLEVGAPAHPR